MAESFREAFRDSGLIGEESLQEMEVKNVGDLVDEYFDILIGSGEPEETINNIHKGVLFSINLQREMGADLTTALCGLFLPKAFKPLPKLYMEIVSEIRKIPDFRNNPFLKKILERFFRDVYEN